MDSWVWGAHLWSLLNNVALTLDPSHITYRLAGRALMQERSQQQRYCRSRRNAENRCVPTTGAAAAACLVSHTQQSGTRGSAAPDNVLVCIHRDNAHVQMPARARHAECAIATATIATAEEDEASRASAASARKDLVTLLYALRHTLPCVYCRHSYRLFVAASPPEHAPDLLAWVYALHEQVNAKLARTGCPLTEFKFRKRLRSWSCPIAPDSAWDLLVIFALDQPDAELAATAEGDAEDDADSEQERQALALDRIERSQEDDQRRDAYALTLATLARLFSRIPALRSMAPFVVESLAGSQGATTPAAFYMAVSSARLHWAQCMGMDRDAIEIMAWCESQLVGDAERARGSRFAFS